MLNQYSCLAFRETILFLFNCLIRTRCDESYCAKPIMNWHPARKHPKNRVSVPAGVVSPYINPMIKRLIPIAQEIEMKKVPTMREMLPGLKSRSMYWYAIRFSIVRICLTPKFNNSFEGLKDDTSFA